MFSSKFLAKVGTVGALLAAGCAGPSSQSAPKDVPALLEPGAYPGTLVYRAPDLDITKYTAILVPPAEIYSGGDAHWDDVSEVDKQDLAAFLTSEYKRVFGENFAIATAPGPGVAQLQLTLAGVTQSRPTSVESLRSIPVGAGLTALKGLNDQPVAFTGSVTIAGELTDSQTGAGLAGFVAKESPQAYDLASGLTKIRASELGITRGAEEFRDALERLKTKPF